VSHVLKSAVYEEICTYGRASCVLVVTGCSIITAPLLSRKELSQSCMKYLLCKVIIHDIGWYGKIELHLDLRCIDWNWSISVTCMFSVVHYDMAIKHTAAE
jgi:hypothetical protein